MRGDQAVHPVRSGALGVLRTDGGEHVRPSDGAGVDLGGVVERFGLEARVLAALLAVRVAAVSVSVLIVVVSVAADLRRGRAARPGVRAARAFIGPRAALASDSRVTRLPSRRCRCLARTVTKSRCSRRRAGEPPRCRPRARRPGARSSEGTPRRSPGSISLVEGAGVTKIPVAQARGLVVTARDDGDENAEVGELRVG